MLQLILFVTIICSSVLTINRQSYSCFLDLSTTDVIVLDGNYEIRTPAANTSEIPFRYQESLIVRCPPGSVTPLLSDSGEELTCVNGTELQGSRTTGSYYYIHFNNIKCTQKLPATVRVSDKECQSSGIQVDVGFEMLESFVTIYTVCFGKKQFVPMNVTYYAPFDKWGIFSSEVTEHYFVDDGHLYEYLDIDQLYANQNWTFTNLGISEYITDQVFLIKGHLLPPYLFSYSLEKEAAFNYVNVVPQWSILENVFAEFVNNFIIEHKLKPSVYQVGTSGVATLKNSENTQVKLIFTYVHASVPVPRWLWFTQLDVVTIYGYNSPYFEESEVEAEFKEMCQLPISFENFKKMLIGVCAGDVNK